MAKAKAAPKTTAAANIAQAGSAGMDARKHGEQREACPYPNGSGLLDAWLKGWDGQDTFEKKSDANQDAPSPVDDAPAATTEGHNHEDPAVKLHDSELTETIKLLAKAGVEIKKEIFRAFADDEKTLCARWARSRSRDILSPIPVILQSYVKDKALLREIAVYLEDQGEFRRIVANCRFGKPSPTKPDSDPEQQIRIKVLIPISGISPTQAHESFYKKRCRIEFSRKGKNCWDQLEFAEFSEGVSCITDIPGYQCSGNWIISFLVSHTQISSSESNRYWGQDGSIRVEPIADMNANLDSREKTENPENESEDGDGSDQGTSEMPDLFDAVSREAMEVDEENDFVSPDEFLIPIKKKDASAMVMVGMGPNKRFHTSSQMIFVAGGKEVDMDDQNPNCNSDGCVTLQEAIKKEVGSMIDWAIEEEAPEDFVSELKDHLFFLEKGGAPIPMPQA